MIEVGERGSYLKVPNRCCCRGPLVLSYHAGLSDTIVFVGVRGADMGFDPAASGLEQDCGCPLKPLLLY